LKFARLDPLLLASHQRKAMKKFIGIIALISAFVPLSHAQENSGGTSASQHPATVGDGVRQVGRDIKTAGHKVRRAVVTLCADGRHTIKGRAGCKGHGGVSVHN
jgi:predicted small secreted protein